MKHHVVRLEADCRVDKVAQDLPHRLTIVVQSQRSAFIEQGNRKRRVALVDALDHGRCGAAGQRRGLLSTHTGSSPITSRCPSRPMASAIRGNFEP